MSRLWIILFSTVVICESFSQGNDTLDLNQALDLSLEDLLKVKINISSVKPVDLLSTPSSVTVLDRELIDQYNFLTVAEALSIVPGIDVLQTVIDWNVATARGILQNFYANKILLMINNVPTWQPIYGDFHLERIDINDVERIEVLKGPASVLYGTNAYVGVINIILRDQKPNAVDAYASLGYPNIYGGGVNVKYSLNDFNLYFSVNANMEDRKPYMMKSDVGFPYNGDTVYNYNERYQTGNFILRGEYMAHSLLINGFMFDHTYYGAFPSYTLGGGTVVDNQGILVNYQFNDNISQNIRFIVNLTHDYFARHFAISADRTEMVVLSGARSSAEGKLNFDFNKFFSFEVGLHGEVRDSYGHESRYAVTDTLIRSNMLNDDNNYEGSVFFQPEFRIGNFTLLAGGRYTKNNLFGSNYSYRGSGLYKLNENNSIKFMVGQSFRVPTMFELYFDHPTVIGNTELQPETSIAHELAYLLRVNDFFVQATGYIASYRNLIRRVPNGIDTLPPVYMNSDQFDGKGFEVEFNYRPGKFGSVFINYNYIAGNNNTGEDNFKYVPDHTINAGINKRFRNFNVYTKGQFISSAHGIVEKIPLQYYIDLGISLKTEMQSLKIKHNLMLKNVTGSDFLIPQYIREQSEVNALPTMGYGRRLIYKVAIHF